MFAIQNNSLSARLFAAALISAAPVAAAHAAGAEMRDADGKAVGAVTLAEVPGGVLITADLSNLPAGAHAFHVHAVGQCEAPFTSAGGHFNPEGKAHGLTVAAGAHAGDMPNLHVPDSGALKIEILNAALRLDDTLFDADGAAVVIHRDGDDYMSDPAGEAGPRIACGVIAR